MPELILERLSAGVNVANFDVLPLYLYLHKWCYLENRSFVEIINFWPTMAAIFKFGTTDELIPTSN